MPIDLKITNGQVCLPEGIFRAGIGVDEGKVVAIGADSALPDAERIIDSSQMIVIPGLIDAHVHFRDPGATHKEDFTSGSMAAACGGVTTILDMPNTSPTVTTRARLEEKAQIATMRSLVDFGLAGGLGANNAERVEELAAAGAIFFKTIMGGYTFKERPEMEELAAFEDGALLGVLGAASRTGLIVSVHAEGEELRQHFTRQLRQSGSTELWKYSLGRPNIVESEAVSRAILLAEITGCRLHICHTSSRETLAHVESARSRGLRVTMETCPHYLLLTMEDVRKYGVNAIMNPPLKSEADRAALLDSLKKGPTDIVATDHAPHTEEEKTFGMEDPWKTPAGIIGVETMLPLLLNLVSEEKLTIQDLVRLTSTNVAKLYGLYPTKGVIRIGSDADLVIVDPRAESAIDKKTLKSKSRNTPFDGWRVRGMVREALVRGITVCRDGEVLGKPGHGRMLRPSAPSYPYAG